MWKDIGKVWQAAFLEGWEAFKHGAVPIGAAITDENGKIICTGRNRIGELPHGNNKIAHAEMDCLTKLDTKTYPNVRSYTLYACMEPCPMCMGTFVMSNLRTLRVAARDRHCGAVHYMEDDPYVKNKNIDAKFELGEMELVQLTMQSYRYYVMNDGADGVVDQKFALDCPQAVELARELYKDRVLDRYAEQGADFGEVYDRIVREGNIV